MRQISVAYWHDGNIVSLYYIFPLTKKDKTKIIIEAEIYPGEGWAAKRQKVRAEFHNVQYINKKIDFNEVVDNIGAGTIDRVTQKEIIRANRKFQEYRFRLFGNSRSRTNMIRIVSNKVKITQL